MHDSAYADAKKFFEDELPRLIDVTRPLRVGDFGSADVNGNLRGLMLPHWKYVSCDIVPGPNVDHVLSSAYSWPEIFDASFDVVVSSQTLEHVPKPWRWVPELVRVLAAGGVMYLCAPNFMEFHEYPVDCWRVWPDGMRALMQDAGLGVVKTYANGIDTTGIGVK